MARTITQIETDITNSVMLKMMEYVKDYLVKKYNLVMTDIDGEFQKIFTQVEGIDKIVAVIPTPLDPAATDPTTANDGDLFFNTTDKWFKYYKGTTWHKIAELSAAIDAYTKAEIDVRLTEKANQVDLQDNVDDIGVLKDDVSDLKLNLADVQTVSDDNTILSKKNETDISNFKKLGIFRGTYADTTARDAAITTPVKGDYVLIGTASPYAEYVYDGAWDKTGSATAPVTIDAYTKAETDAKYFTKAQALVELPKKLDETKFNTEIAKYELKTDIDTALALKQDKLSTTQKAVVDGKVYTQAEKTKLAGLEAGAKFLGDFAVAASDTDAQIITALDGAYSSAKDGNYAEVIQPSATTSDVKYTLFTKGASTWTKGVERTEHIITGTSTPLAFYAGQVVMFSVAKVGTKFEDSSLFEKHIVSDGQAIVGGSGGGTTYGEVIRHQHSLNQNTGADGGKYFSYGTSNGSHPSGTSSGSYHVGWKTGSTGGSYNKAYGIQILQVIYVAKKDIKTTEMITTP